MDNLIFEVSFRFHQLNKLQLATLCRELDAVSSTEITENEPDTKQANYVALVALTAANLDAINMFYVRQGLDISNCDILVTAQNTAAISFTLPGIVNQMLKHIDCPLSIVIRT